MTNWSSRASRANNVTGPHPDQAPVVLLVDDEPAVLRVMSRILERAGFLVVTATSGLHAISLAAELPAPPDIVVTDLRMEPIDGSALARLILAVWPETRFLFVSGFHTKNYKDLPGAILAKPFTTQALVEHVQRLCAVPRSASRRA